MNTRVTRHPLHISNGQGKGEVPLILMKKKAARNLSIAHRVNIP